MTFFPRSSEDLADLPGSQDVRSPPSESEGGKINAGLSSSTLEDGSGTSCPSSGNPSKSPLRSRKSSLSAVIDKLRSQHNPEAEIFQNGTE